MEPVLTAGWLAESITANATPIWIFGAGHVGEALARNLAPLTGFDITVIDTEAARIPTDSAAKHHSSDRKKHGGAGQARSR